jgi:glycosyltransferase involved in cell wall biosynthesis
MTHARRASDGVAQRLTIVVPCFNEEKRLDGASFFRLLGSLPSSRLLFVDDASTDATRAIVAGLEEKGRGAIRSLALAANRGKAEAVRVGMKQAIAEGAEIVGYLDADFATPVEDVCRLAAEIREPELDVVIGSRVQLLGHVMERSPVRHYFGRVFATAASLLLEQPVYDTQCGAKLFRATPLLDEILSVPFRTRWIFDVELLGRLLIGTQAHAAVRPEAVRELPLRRWRDVAGSKLRPGDFAWAAIDLAVLTLELRALRDRVQETKERPPPI